MTVGVRRVCTLLLVVTVSGLLSGGAAGAALTTSAVVTALIEAVPERYRDGGAGVGAAAAAPSVVQAPPPPAPARRAIPEPTAAGPTTTGPTTTEPGTSEPTTTEQNASDDTEQNTAEEPRTVSGTPCRSTARACIDLAGNQAWLIRDGDVSYGPVPITHGRKGFRTPPGTFEVSFRNRDHVSSIYDAPMPYSVFFNGGIAFHQGSLEELSHGCIHLSRSAAREFFDSLRRGDVVQVVR